MALRYRVLLGVATAVPLVPATACSAAGGGSGGSGNSAAAVSVSGSGAQGGGIPLTPAATPHTLTETGSTLLYPLRFGLERSYRAQARQAPDLRRRIELVDLANDVRPGTWS